MYVLDSLAEVSNSKAVEMLSLIDGFLCCQDPVGCSLNDSL